MNSAPIPNTSPITAMAQAVDTASRLTRDSHRTDPTWEMVLGNYYRAMIQLNHPALAAKEPFHAITA
jgi:hypothetical protein